MKPSDINAEIMETAPNQQVEQSRVVSYRCGSTEAVISTLAWS